MGITVRRPSGSALGALCALALVGSCSKTPTNNQPAGAAVSITPGSLSFATLNASQQLTATVVDQSGHPVTGASVTWSSTNISVALVSAGGLVSAVTNGTAKIVATSGTVADTVTATVAQVPATITKVSGDGQSWATNATLPQALTVRVADSGGSGVAGQVVTFGVVTGGGSLIGTAPPTSVSGQTSIQWTLGGTVGSQSVSASRPPASPVTFAATATAPGIPTQIAKYAGDGETGLDNYAINVAPAVIVKDASGLPVSGVSVTFAVATGGGSVTGPTTTTSASGVATVGAWTVQNGPNTLTATAAPSGITNNPLTFSALGQTAQYTIETQYIVAVSPSRHAAVDSAVAHWERVIYGAITPVPMNVAAGTCGSKSPAINETVNGVLIFIELDSIDGPGKILGQAGPCYVRVSGRLPIAGLIQLDTADVVGLEGAGEFNEVILHEMGHVLGFGTIWDSNDLNLLANPSQSGGTDPHFIGPQAITEFDAIGGASYTGGSPVPVEDSGGPGTADGHWRERVFHTELMTGFLNGGVANPLSIITIASMGDEGYTVNYAAAESYTQTFSLRAGAAGPAVHLTHDILPLPIYVMSTSGQVMGVMKR